MSSGRASHPRRSLKSFFGQGVHVDEGVIQDQEPWIAQTARAMATRCSGRRKEDAALADHGAIAFREAGDVGSKSASSAPRAISSCDGTLNAPGDVSAQCRAEQKGLLRNEPNLAAYVWCGSKSRRSIPSIQTSPRVGSSKRGIRFTSVVFPLPVWPTIATVDPAGKWTVLMQSKARSRGVYRTVTSRNSDMAAPSDRSRSTGWAVAAGATMPGRSSKHLQNSFPGGPAALHQIHHPPHRDHRPHQHPHVGIEHHEAAERDMVSKADG